MVHDCFGHIGHMHKAILKLFAYWVIFHAFLLSTVFFSKSTFSKNSFRNTIRESNSLDPDQARQFGLIWVQIVCKGYQQTTLVGKELNMHDNQSSGARGLN